MAWSLRLDASLAVWKGFITLDVTQFAIFIEQHESVVEVKIDIEDSGRNLSTWHEHQAGYDGAVPTSPLER